MYNFVKFMKEKLESHLSPNYLKIIDESKLHNNKNSHFKIVIVTNKFSNISIIERHRTIYNFLKEEKILNRIHALSISTFTIHEWKKRNQKIHTTPCCQHIIK